MIRALVLTAFLAVGAGAQSFHYVLNGGQTNSEVTVPTPPWEPWATQAVVTVQHRARLQHGWETDLILTPGVTADCVYSALATMRQGYSVSTGGARIGSNRSYHTFSRTGACVTMDGTLDFGGTTGGTTPWLIRPTTLTFQIPVEALGPNITVRTECRSYTDLNISCNIQVPPIPGTHYAEGRLYWFNRSEWEADLYVSYE